MADILQTFSGAGFKVSFIGLLFACLLHIVGFATDYWSSYNDVSSSWNMGLWRVCGCDVKEQKCECAHFPEDRLIAWLKAVRAMETLGLIFIVVAICGSVWILIKHQGNSIKMIPTLLISGAGHNSYTVSYGVMKLAVWVHVWKIGWKVGVQILIGVVVYGAKIHEFGRLGLSLHYSFALCCCSGSMCFIMSLLMGYAYSTTCRRSGEDTTITLTTTDAVTIELPATIERAGYDQPGNDPLRYEQPRIGRPGSQPREDSLGQRTQYTTGGVLAGLPSRGINSPPACTPGDDYLRGQQVPVFANSQNVPEGNITIQPSQLTENLQRTPEK